MNASYNGSAWRVLATAILGVTGVAIALMTIWLTAALSPVSAQDVENHSPVASVGFAYGSDQTVPEGGTVSLWVRLAGWETATRTVSVQAEFSDGRHPQTLEIETGSGSTRLEVVVPDDDIVNELPITLTVTLSAPVNAVLTADLMTVVLTVLDDDISSVDFGADDPSRVASVGFTGHELEVEEGAPVTLRVMLADWTRATRTIRVQAEFSDGRQPQTLEIETGSVLTTLEFVAPDDDIGNVVPSPLRVTLSAPVNAVLTADLMTVVITVYDDDMLRAVFDYSDRRRVAVEGDTVALRVVLPRGKVATQPINVRVDYSDLRPSETITIKSGSNSALLTFVAPDDDIAHAVPNALTLTPSGARVWPFDERAVVRFVDNDNDDLASLGFAVDDLSHTVQEARFVRLTVELANGVIATRTISAMVHYSPYYPYPYDWPPSRAISIDTGTGSTQLSLLAPFEFGESTPPVLTLTLGPPTNGVLTAGRHSATIVMVNDDDYIPSPLLYQPCPPVCFRTPDPIVPQPRLRPQPQPQPTSVGFGADDLSRTVAEGDRVALRVELARDKVAAQPINVRVDYSDLRPSETITIKGGSSSTSLTFVAPDDDIANAVPNALTLTLSGAPLTSGFERAVVRFADDDLASLGFAVDDLSRTVQELGLVSLTVELANGAIATRTISAMVRYSRPTYAEPSPPQAISINRGTGSTLLNLRVPFDLRLGSTPPVLTLTLGPPINGVLAAGRHVATIATVDNVSLPPPPPPPNPPPPCAPLCDEYGNFIPEPTPEPPRPPINRTLMITVLPSTAESVEEGDSITYTITSTDVGTAVDVMVRITGSNANADPSDLSMSTPIHIPAGTASVEHVITALMDELREDAERFRIAFTPVDASGSPLGPAQLRELTVTNRELFKLVANDDTVVENGLLVVRITRPANVELNREFDLAITARHADSREPVTADLAFPSSMAIAPGAAYAEFRVRALLDGVEESAERFELSVAGAGTIEFTVIDALLPGAGGLQLAWWQIGALAILGALTVASALIALAGRRPSARGNAPLPK